MTDVNDFLASLAAAIAAMTALERAATPRQLWTHEVIGDDAAETRSVMRIYGGPISLSMIRVPAVSIQVETSGTDQQEVLSQAWLIYESLLDESGHPRGHWTIDSETDGQPQWEVKLVHFQNNAPGVTGRDVENGRWTATFNFDVEFMAES